MKKLKDFFVGNGKWQLASWFIVVYVSFYYVLLVLAGGPPSPVHIFMQPGHLALAYLFGVDFGFFVAQYMYLGILLLPAVVSLFFLCICHAQMHPNECLDIFGVRVLRAKR